MAVLRYVYQASAWWTPGAVRSGIMVEVAKEWPGAVRPGQQRELQELLEQIISAVKLDPTLELGRVAEQLAMYMQMVGGGLLWLRCIEGPTSVTVYLSDT